MRLLAWTANIFRISDSQWQYRRRLPQWLAGSIGRTWFIKNLGTDSLSRAKRLRNRFNVDMTNLEAALQFSWDVIKDGLTFDKQIGPDLFELARIGASSSIGIATKHEVVERVGSPIDKHLH